jgi:hypothetical protein
VKPPWWRWLVIRQDTEGEHREVVWGYLTRKRARHEARMARLAQVGAPYWSNLWVEKR